MFTLSGLIRVRTLLVIGLAYSSVLAGCERREAAREAPEQWTIKADPTLVPVVTPSQGALGRTPVWVNDGPNRDLTVFGAFHAIRANTAWAPPALLEACQANDVVFLEEPKATPADIAMLEGLSPPGPPWAGLTSSERERLAGILRRLNFGLSDYTSVDTGRMILHLEVAIATSRGQGGAPHAERWAAISCAGNGKRLRALEAAGAYTRIIMTLPQERKLAMLHDFIATPARHPEIQAKLYEAWIRGDLAAIQSYAAEDEARWHALGVGDSILKDRNAAWAKVIKQTLEEGKRVLVIVGLAHVAGPDSLIDALAAEGVRLKLAPPPPAAEN